MDKTLANWTVSNLQKKIEGMGVDPFSKEYFYAKKHAAHRSQTVPMGDQFISRSRLSVLIREGMAEEHRKRIFSSNFDLGNMRTVPPELCTYEKLADDLYGEGRTGIEANDAFETIQKGIHRITGKKMHEHFRVNKSTALKVIKTLNLLLRQRQPSLMQLLTLPKPNEKFSMSFRDAFPYEKNQEQVWLIADLKTYLSAELSDVRMLRISITFSHLHEIMNNIVRDVTRVLRSAYPADYASRLHAYKVLAAAVEGFQFQYEQKDLPLDEELYIHLHILEFAHFATGYPQLIKKAIPQCPITPVTEELRVLLKKAVPTLWVKINDDESLISIRDVPAFLQRWQKEITAIMQKAMEVDVTLKEYDEIQISVQNVLRNFYWLQTNGDHALREDRKCANPWYIVAALCCVWYTQFKSPVNFQPFWKGQSSQGGSINSSRKVSIAEEYHAIENVPEEHHHIWATRFEWFVFALKGHAALMEHQFAFRSVLVSKVSDICHTNNTERIVQNLRIFMDYLKEHTHKYHKEG